MTFTLRRKRRTTVPASPTTAPTGISHAARTATLVLGGFLLTGLTARAQDFSLPKPPADLPSPYGQKADAKAPARFDPEKQGIPVKPLREPLTTAPGRRLPNPVPVIRPVVMQVPVPIDRRYQESETLNPQIQLNPPGPERLFRLETESDWKERMRQEARERGPQEPAVTFPDEPVLTTASYAPRTFPPLSEVVEPGYVAYKRLYFEQKNFERGGWDLGFITPFVSAGVFFLDVATLPYHAGTQPLRHYDTGAGQCLPGDPAPFLLYPPEFSLTGAMAEAGTVVALFAIFPAP